MPFPLSFFLYLCIAVMMHDNLAAIFAQTLSFTLTHSLSHTNTNAHIHTNTDMYSPTRTHNFQLDVVIPHPPPESVPPGICNDCRTSVH